MSIPVRYNTSFASAADLQAYTASFETGDEAFVGGYVYQFDASSTVAGTGIIVGHGGRWLKQMGGVHMTGLPSTGQLVSAISSSEAEWRTVSGGGAGALVNTVRTGGGYPQDHTTVQMQTLSMVATGATRKVRVSGYIAGGNGAGQSFAALLYVDASAWPGCKIKGTTPGDLLILPFDFIITAPILGGNPATPNAYQIFVEAGGSFFNVPPGAGSEQFWVQDLGF